MLPRAPWVTGLAVTMLILWPAAQNITEDCIREWQKIWRGLWRGWKGKKEERWSEKQGEGILSLLWFVGQAIKYHKQELTISKEVNDRSSEASTHGNLAVAYQALGAHEMALLHYRAHLNTARELKDTAGEACALLNLGNCLSSRGEFGQAVPFYENYLMLSQVPSGSHMCLM